MRDVPITRVDKKISRLSHRDQSQIEGEKKKDTWWRIGARGKSHVAKRTPTLFLSNVGRVAERRADAGNVHVWKTSLWFPTMFILYDMFNICMHAYTTVLRSMYTYVCVYVSSLH